MARYIDADDFLDLFYVAATGQDKEFTKTVEMVVADTPTADVVSREYHAAKIAELMEQIDDLKKSNRNWRRKCQRLRKQGNT